MNRKPLETLEIPESRKLRERAINCHRLAVGADDPQFTIKLNALADEYEAKAVEADAKASSDKK
jgi:hypothetical protein